MNPLCLFFRIVRDRGVAPQQTFETTAGERLIIGADGGLTLAQPSYSEIPSGSGTRIELVARTMREARKMLKGVKRKYPGADIKASLDNATVNQSYPKGAVHFGLQFGGELAGRSIVKSVTALAHHSGIAATNCGLATNYLRDASATPCFGYYYENDLVDGRPQGVPLHCVAVSGNPSTGLLLGYVEYFGLQRVVVCLSDTFRGNAFDRAYAIDPMTGQEINLSVRLSFSASDIADIYEYKKFPDGALQRVAAEVIPTGLKKQFEIEKDRVTRDAVRYAFANCGAKEGEMLTEEQVKKLSRLVAERITPFILHNRRS